MTINDERMALAMITNTLMFLMTVSWTHVKITPINLTPLLSLKGAMERKHYITRFTRPPLMVYIQHKYNVVN